MQNNKFCLTTNTVEYSWINLKNILKILHTKQEKHKKRELRAKWSSKSQNLGPYLKTVVNWYGIIVIAKYRNKTVLLK